MSVYACANSRKPRLVGHGRPHSRPRTATVSPKLFPDNVTSPSSLQFVFRTRTYLNAYFSWLIGQSHPVLSVFIARTSENFFPAFNQLKVVIVLADKSITHIYKTQEKYSINFLVVCNGKKKKTFIFWQLVKSKMVYLVPSAGSIALKAYILSNWDIFFTSFIDLSYCNGVKE